MDIFYNVIINYSILIVTQFLLGKKGSFVYALLFNMNLYIVSIVIIISDIILMFLVGGLFKITVKHVFPFTLLQRNAKTRESRIKESKLTAKVLKFGRLGPMIITAIPFSGGVWSGILVSKILKLSNKETYWQVSVGSVIGCLIFLLAALGFIEISFQE